MSTESGNRIKRLSRKEQFDLSVWFKEHEHDVLAKEEWVAKAEEVVGRKIHYRQLSKLVSEVYDKIPMTKAVARAKGDRVRLLAKEMQKIVRMIDFIGGKSGWEEAGVERVDDAFLARAAAGKATVQATAKIEEIRQKLQSPGTYKQDSASQG